MDDPLCPKCGGPMETAGELFYEQGEYNDWRMKYEKEGEASVFRCKCCDCRIAILD